MWTVRNIAAVIWIESGDTAFCIRKLYVVLPIAKSIYTEQNYYNTATQHENSKSSNSELLFELWYFSVSVSTILVQFLGF